MCYYSKDSVTMKDANLFRQLVVLCFLLALKIQTTETASTIPDKSIFWSARQGRFYFLNPTNTTAWLYQQDTSNLRLQPVAIPGTKSIYGISFDYSTDHMIISDPDSYLISMVSLDLEKAVPFHIGASPGVGQLTIDWRARNVYWTDSDYGWIAMKSFPISITTLNSFDRSVRVIIDNFLDVPTGIVVFPAAYYLFWADAGSQPKIERSNLVGGERNVLVWQGLITPTCLSIDNQTYRLFWSDPERQTIEYIFFNGTGRTVFASDGYDYFGIAVFQGLGHAHQPRHAFHFHTADSWRLLCRLVNLSHLRYPPIYIDRLRQARQSNRNNRLIFTSPTRNRTGVYSLTNSFSGISLEFNTPLYYVDVFDKDSQPRSPLEPCESDQFPCEQICVHMENDRGATCFCEDGYDLVLESQCKANQSVLERHLLFTYNNQICATSINVIYSPTGIKPETNCNLIQHNGAVTRFSIDMNDDYIFYTDGQVIYKQLAFSNVRTILHTSNNTILDFDFNWKTRELFWAESGVNYLLYKKTDEPEAVANQSLTSPFQIRNLALNPHNSRVFWVAFTGVTYKLYTWNREDNSVAEITTSALSRPTDIEYDRANDRVLWNDESFYGIIRPDGTGVQKINTFPDIDGVRHGITDYKKLVLITIEDGQNHFDAIFDGRQGVVSVTAKDIPFNATILDVHVFDSSTQQDNLDACDVNNFGCQHICLPNDIPECACGLGYNLLSDGKSCGTSILDDNFTLVLDSQYGHVYQLETNTQPVILRRVGLAPANSVTAISFDDARNKLVWVDNQTKSVRSMDISGGSEITLTGSDFLETSVIAVDVINELICVSKGRKIYTLDTDGQSTITLDERSIRGIVKSIAVNSDVGKIVWLEGGIDPRIMRSNLNGTGLQTVMAYDSTKIAVPEVIKFDPSDGNVIYWCDSYKDKIERIDSTLIPVAIYQNQQHNPVAFDVDENNVYYIPQEGRSIYIINKQTGAEVSAVMKTPLLGAIGSIHVSRQISLPTTTTTTKMVPTSESADFPIVPVAAGAGGGLVLLIIVIIVAVWRVRKKNEKTAMRRPSQLPTLTEVNKPETNGRMHDYASGIGPQSPDPPPRPLTEAERADGGEYDYLNEAELRVDLPAKDGDPKHTAQRRASDRYSRFPLTDEIDYNRYFTPVHKTGDVMPRPDYDGAENGYLELKESSKQRLGMTDDRFLRGSVNSGFSDSEDGYLTSSISNNRVEYSRQPRENRDFSDGSVSNPRGRHRDFDKNDPYQRERRDFSNYPNPQAHTGGWHGSRSGSRSGSKSVSGSGYSDFIARR